MTYYGALRELSPVADPVTRIYAARVANDDPDARILLGMTAKARFFRPSGKARLSVPPTAIFQQNDEQPALWVVNADQSVARRPVSVASCQEDTAVLASGAQGGERIVVTGVHKLNNGEPVRAIDQPARPDEQGQPATPAQ